MNLRSIVKTSVFCLAATAFARECHAASGDPGVLFADLLLPDPFRATLRSLTALASFFLVLFVFAFALSRRRQRAAKAREASERPETESEDVASGSDETTLER